MRRFCSTLCILLAAAALFAEPVAEMSAYLDKAGDAADSNHLAEAIRSYVTVLAMAEESPSTEASAKAKEAQTQLARIGTRLSLEPGSEWLDAKGGQIAGSSTKIGKVDGLSPSVYLFENFGTGKSPVADAPVYFQFAKNSGSIVTLVTTDAYGKANTTIARLESPGAEALVRAYPLFRARGKAYAFQSVFRDFAYLPPANVVKLFDLESSELGTSDNPLSADAAAEAIKRAGMQVQPINAKTSLEHFRGAFAGDAKELAALGIDASSPYAALVLVEVAPARQMELNGKKYNIFTAIASASFRLLRSDGSIVFSLPVEGIKGQAANKEAAVADSYRRTRDALSAALQKKDAELKSALINSN
jgi:hypothetical protein